MSAIPAEESDQLLIRPLGAGQEVGRSCIILEFKGRKIMLDCGIHPGLEGMDALPYIDLIDPAEIDLLLISHFHLDHCGALPWFLQKTSFKGRTFMTHATKAIYRWLLSDYVKVSNISADDMLYTETDLEESMDKIETINFHEVKEVAGIKFWCYHAGHVLGAAMFMIEIAGVKLLYTGDFSRQEDRHLMAAEIPNIKPDILIIESTYGTHIHEKREEREARFCNTVHDIVNRGGRGLIPVFALGRAQELLLILDEYWQNHPELHDIPIYYASSLAKKCMAVYQTYVNAMNDKIRKQININNPFVFKHISNLKSMDHFDDIGPSVVMASPGMIQNGLSRELFESWCTDKRNGVIIAGYCVEGTLAKILVHGEQNEMARLKAALIREYEDNDEVHIEVHNPRNTEAVTLNFRGEKLAKVMGFLADKKPEQGQRVSGILVKRNFNYHILSPCDLSNYTDLAMSTVKQTQAIPYTGPFNLLYYQLQKLTGDVEELEIQEKPALKVFKNITVIQEPGMVVLEWLANPSNDMYADTVTTVILEVQSNPKIRKGAVQKVSKKLEMHVYSKRLEVMLQDIFGEDCVSVKDDSVLSVTVDGKTANINLETRLRQLPLGTLSCSSLQDTRAIACLGAMESGETRPREHDQEEARERSRLAPPSMSPPPQKHPHPAQTGCSERATMALCERAASGSSLLWPRVVLFGDSITQFSFQPGGWGALLADRLVRKCDVLNRGFSGYNTRWAKIILPRLISKGSGMENPVAVTVFFGANDATLKDENPKQHVPLDEYSANLRAMVQYLRSVDILEERVILITPPPLGEAAWEKECILKAHCQLQLGQTGALRWHREATCSRALQVTPFPAARSCSFLASFGSWRME
ncbi:cleavage and polyadenylation specificity factor 3 [Cricetulus griseus]